MCTLLAVCLSGLEDEIIEDMKRHVYSVRGSDATNRGSDATNSSSSSSNRHVRFEVLSVTSSTHPYIACNNNNNNNNQANNNQANNRSSSTAVHDPDGCIVINGKKLYQGEAGCGKILIHNVMDYSFINYVRSVQHWFIYVTHSYDIHTTSTIHGRESIQAALTGSSVGNKLLSSNHCKCTEEASTGDNSGNNDSGNVDWEQCVSYWKQALRVVKRVATNKDIIRTVGI